MRRTACRLAGRRRRAVVEVGQNLTRQTDLELPFDAGKDRTLVGRHEDHRIAGVAGSPGSSDPVDVFLGRGGHVEVDDVRDVPDVEVAGGDIGRDQDRVDLRGSPGGTRPLGGGAVACNSVTL